MEISAFLLRFSTSKGKYFEFILFFVNVSKIGSFLLPIQGLKNAQHEGVICSVYVGSI